MSEDRTDIEEFVALAREVGITQMQWIFTKKGYEVHVDGGYSFTGETILECLSKAIEMGEGLRSDE